MPGVGKSTTGKMVAQKLGRKFVDLDTLIEQLFNSKVVDIIREHGELRFRQCETEALTVTAKESELVVATGGGTVLSDENMEIMQKTGVPILLVGSPDTLAKRLQRRPQKRPLLGANITAETVSELQAERDSAYNKVKCRIDIGALSQKQVAERIIEEVSA